MSRANALLFLFILILAVVLEVSVLPVYLISSFRPDLLLIVVVFLGLRGGLESGTSLAWLLGLVKDTFSGLYLGLNAFSFLLVYFVLKNTSDRLYADRPGLFVISVCVASIACSMINMLLLLMLTSSTGIAYSIFADLIPHMLINSFVASLVSISPWFESPQEA